MSPPVQAASRNAKTVLDRIERAQYTPTTMEKRDRPYLRRLLRLVIELAEARAAKTKEPAEFPPLTDTAFVENLLLESRGDSTPSKEAVLSMPLSSIRIH
jgi:hypothetical protein